MLEPNDTILIAHGDNDEAWLTKAALRHAGFNNSTQRVIDLYDAMQYLSGGGEYKHRGCFPMPSLIVCDFRLDATELVQWMHGRPDLPDIPVVVVAAPDPPFDLQAAEYAGAHAVVAKTADLFTFAARITDAVQGVVAITRHQPKPENSPKAFQALLKLFAVPGVARI